MKQNKPKHRSTKRLLITCGVLLALLVFCHIQNTMLTVTQYTYKNKKLPESFDGYRIVQISDLHNASFGADNKRLIKKIGELAPDMIAITGDLVDSGRTNTRVALSFVEQACEIAPVYYVTGNHEHWLDEEIYHDLMAGMEDAGAVLLMNAVVEICKEDAGFTLIGLEDESLGGGALKQLTEGTDPGQFQLLLAHEPQYLDSYSDRQVDLVLTGHAHGGQFRLPLVGGLIAPDQGFFPEYTEGMHKNGSTSMIISRGLGNSIIPVRLFNLPEIVCVELAAD